MAKQLEQQLQEDLSLAIDAINAGRRPPAGNPEIRQLAEVAALLKQAGPPPGMAEMISTQVAGELAGQKKRRKTWLVSGAASTAAAALLVLAINLQNPVSPEQTIPLPPAGSITIETLPAPQPEAAADRADSAAAPAVQAPAEAQPALPPPQKQAEAQPEQQRTAVVSERHSAFAPPPAVKKSVTAKAADQTVRALVLPGHKPDSSTTDPVSGRIRQVYDAGSDRQIIITQGTQPTVAAGTTRLYSVTALPENDTQSAETKNHKVTVNIGGREVTVEGLLPEEELLRLAQSLVEE